MDDATAMVDAETSWDLEVEAESAAEEGLSEFDQQLVAEGKKRPPSNKAKTPLLKQYLEIKEAHPNDVLFFRMGDFYEMFFEDAVLVSKVLSITLTSRSHIGKGKDDETYAMAGFPHHALDRYLPRMIQAGYRVAICEQVEDPALVKGKRCVKREVVEVVTPGTLTDEKLLEERQANFLLAVHAPRGWVRKGLGLAWFEVASGRFLACEVEADALEAELARIGPAEIVVAERVDLAAREEDSPEAHLVGLLERYAPLATVPDWTVRVDGAVEGLQQGFGVGTLAGMGLDSKAGYVPAAHAVLHYVDQKKPGFLEHLAQFGRGIELYTPGTHLSLDPATVRCLELVSPIREGGSKAATLLGAVDRTRTSMGGRLLKEWLLSPLRQRGRIEARQEAVAALVAAPQALRRLVDALRNVQDLERLTGRVASGKASPRDLAALRDSLGLLPEVKAAALEAAGDGNAARLAQAAEGLDPMGPLQEFLERALVERPAVQPSQGEIVAEGFSEELDELRGLTRDVKQTLADFQAREVEETGIPSLKIGFNKVFGYYLEVTQAHRKKVPNRYIRKQTLKNCERYLTPELKELEEKILSARERSEQLETSLIDEIRDEIGDSSEELLKTASLVAQLDVLSAFAVLARERSYVRPVITEGTDVRIQAGRHPVLDVIEAHGTFVPNDVNIGGDAGLLHVLTGPNMAGKSTYIRQAALLVLLAQVGSFVPAEAAEVGVVDRIFARVGSGDELAKGLSTFMVEMTESANILRHATDRSLVILDEVGRGTSTYDGVSLAWAIAEYLHDQIGARTLFATHYHELTGLPERCPGVRNYNVRVEERGQDIFFLHQIREGSADRSYGIHVARLAGVPRKVLSRARVILKKLESGTFDLAGTAGDPQLGLFAAASAEPEEEAPDELRERLAELDVMNTTPMEALQLLDELKRLAGS